MKDQSSPDRTNNTQFKPIGNIDKLIRENLRKKRERDEIDKLERELNDQYQQLKKHRVEQINDKVRK